MSRYAKANQTTDNLADRIAGNCDTDYTDADVYFLLNSESTPAQLTKDLSKVDVCFENVEAFGSEDAYNHLPGLEDLDGYEMIGEGDSAFPVLWCAGGGDWELPLVFVLYIGQKGELRAYIPEDGNAFNHEEMAAYGNNKGDPVYGKGDPRYVFDVAKMRADVAKSIVVKA